MTDNMIEDKGVEKLFADYRPDLTSDFVFMQRLERNLDAVEIVRKRNEATRRRGRRALVAAALAGFVAGAIFTLAVPYITKAVNDLLSSTVLASLPAQTGYLASWLIAAAATIFASVTTFTSLSGSAGGSPREGGR